MADTDDFTNTDGTQLTAHNAQWQLNSGDFDIQSNALAADGAVATTECMAGYTGGEAVSDDHAAECTIASVSATANARIGPAVRVAIDGTANGVGLVYEEDSNETFMYKLVGGVPTQLGASFTATRTAGEKMRLEVNGDEYDYQLDTGGGFVSQGTRTDTTFATGVYGVAGKGTTINQSVADWLGESLGTATTVITRSRKLATQQRMVS